VTTPAAAPQLLPAPSVATPKPAGTFWSSSSSVLAVALVTALLLGVAILLLLRPIKEGVKSRVGDFIVSDDGASADVGIAASGGATVPRILLRRGWWGPYSEDVDAARIRRTPLQLVKLSLGAYVLSMVLGSFALGSPSIMFLAVIPNGALRTLRIVVRRLAKRQRAKFADQLPSHLQDLAGAMRAGRSIVGALASVADGAAEPIRTELERALADERLGLPLEETLQAVADRMASEDMEQVALVAALHRRSGSNVAEALDRVAESARDRADMRREMKALTAQARISGWVLSLLPPTLLVAMALIAPGYAKPMWSTTVGIIALVFSGLLVLAGRFVMSRIVNVEA
jgi:tight adherence protein B